MKPRQSSSDTRRTITAVMPAVTALLFVFAGAAPAAIPGYSDVTPLLSVVAIFFWVIARPNLMPPAAVFVIGIFQDVLSGGPIGLWAMTFLMVQYLSLSMRRFLYGETFLYGWAGFASIVMAAAFFAWTGACFFYGALLPPWPVFFQAMLTILIYPVAVWVLIRLSRWIPATN